MKKILPIAMISALIGTASAAPRITAQSIIVNPTPSYVNVSVWTDRDPSGTTTPSYAPGDRIQLYVRASQDSYVYLFNVDPQGQVDLILPNGYSGGDNYVRAGSTKVFPQPGAGFTFDIAAPYGVNKVLALASTSPLNMNDIASFNYGQNNFARVNVQGQQQLAQALSIVVNPIQQNTWNSDTAYYNVAPRNTYSTPNYAPNPVRPVPVRPVPVRPAPVQPAPVVTTPIPWVNNGPVWNGYVDYRYGLQNTHEQYANQLRAQGYRLVNIREYSNVLRSEWTNGYSNAVLDVRQVNGRIEVRITQR